MFTKVQTKKRHTNTNIFMWTKSDTHTDTEWIITHITIFEYFKCHIHVYATIAIHIHNHTYTYVHKSNYQQRNKLTERKIYRHTETYTKPHTYRHKEAHEVIYI